MFFVIEKMFQTLLLFPSNQHPIDLMLNGPFRHCSYFSIINRKFESPLKRAFGPSNFHSYEIKVNIPNQIESEPWVSVVEPRGLSRWGIFDAPLVIFFYSVLSISFYNLFYDTNLNILWRYFAQRKRKFYQNETEIINIKNILYLSGILLIFLRNCEQMYMQFEWSSY